MTAQSGPSQSKIMQSDESSRKKFEISAITEATPMSAAHSLKEIDEHRQGFANRLAGIFRDRPIKLLHEIPSISSHGIFADERGLYFQPLSRSNGPVIVNSDDLDSLVGLLKDSEKVISFFENRTGIGFEPVELSNQITSEIIWLEISLSEDQDEKDSVNKARFGFSPALQHLDALASPQDIPVLFRMPIKARISLCGPALNMTDAANLAKGDLVLLSNQNCKASLLYDLNFSNHMQTAQGHFNLVTGQFQSTFQQASTDQGEMQMTEQTPDRNMQETTKQFNVPVKITLPEIAVPADKLASLKEGTTLEIGQLAIGLQVDLNVGGRSIGNGEIIKIGDNFAVLIDHIIGANDSLSTSQEGVDKEGLLEEEHTAQVEES